MKMLTVGVLMLGMCLFASAGWAGQAEEYNLNERCGKQADVFFKSSYEGGWHEYASAIAFQEYENHYNKRMNTCFIHIKTMMISKEHNPTIYDHSILDVNEHKEYGSYTGTEDTSPRCYVLGSRCKSLKEWLILTMPFMEE